MLAAGGAASLAATMNQLADQEGQVSDPVGKVRQATRAGRRRGVTLRRSLIGVATAGAGAAMLVTSIASGAPAGAAATASAGAPGAVTATSSMSQASGNLSLTVKYARGPHGRYKLTSVAYSGGSTAKLRHPALLITIHPAAPFPVPRKRHAFALGIFFRLSSAASFSGSLPAKLLASINKTIARQKLPPLDLLTVSVVPAPRKHRGQTIALAGLLQTAVLLTP